jgi:hypothetical protein
MGSWEYSCWYDAKLLDKYLIISPELETEHDRLFKKNFWEPQTQDCATTVRLDFAHELLKSFFLDEIAVATAIQKDTTPLGVFGSTILENGYVSDESLVPIGDSTVP